MALILFHSIYRDIILESQYPGDLRNRVVGSRLIHDGKLPYNYMWKISDSIRYYDFNNIYSEKGISNITASPFFHQLFNSLFELPQRTVSRIWLGLQYFFLLAVIFMICALTPDYKIKWLIINTSILFTLTEAWKFSISSGQLYFYIGFLICLILYFMVINKKPFLIFAGLITAIFVLTRPIGIILFIPILFYYKEFFVYLATSLSLLGIYLIFILTNADQKALYKDYFNALRLHVNDFRETEFENNIAPPKHNYYTDVEGFSLDEMYGNYKEHPIKIYSENGNIFVLYYKMTHQKMSMAMLNGLLAGTLLCLIITFLIFHRNSPPGNLQIILFGLILYLIVELFSPINRHQYYTVQWLPLVLTSFLLIPSRMNTIFLLLIAGLALNICNFELLPMRHTMGEFCWFAAILMLVFSSRYKYPSWKKQS